MEQVRYDPIRTVEAIGCSWPEVVNGKNIITLWYKFPGIERRTKQVITLEKITNKDWEDSGNLLNLWVPKTQLLEISRE